MDGYAVRAADTSGVTPGLPQYLKITGEVAMGEVPWQVVEPGEALRLPTGGMLPPGADAPATYDSDERTNYELGLRTGNASGSFSLDVAAFFLDWKDIQLFQVVDNFGVNANGGTAESWGLEFTATARSGGLSMTFAGAYTDAELTEDTDPLVGGFDGDALPFVPEWTLAVGGDYEWAAFGDATAYVGGQVAYTGDRPAGFDNRVDPDRHRSRTCLGGRSRVVRLPRNQAKVIMVLELLS